MKTEQGKFGGHMSPFSTAPPLRKGLPMLSNTPQAKLASPTTTFLYGAPVPLGSPLLQPVWSVAPCPATWTSACSPQCWPPPQVAAAGRENACRLTLLPGTASLRSLRAGTTASRTLPFNFFYKEKKKIKPFEKTFLKE